MRTTRKKSRLGCLACKRRKIKCDESRPECGKCLQFGIKCDFSVLPASSVAAQASPHDSPPRRGRPRADWTSWAEEIRLSRTTAAPEQERMVLNAQDIEAYHNYITKAAVTMSENDEDAGLWLEGAPHLGFQQPCILHLILAFSAYHIAHVRPHDAARFSKIGEDHCNTALKAATKLLRHFEPANGPALYITAVLVCFTALAQGPRRGDWFVVAADGQVPWLSLIRGVKLVVSTAGWPSIFSGPLAKYTPKTGFSHQQEDEFTEVPAVPSNQEDWRLSLQNVFDVVDLLAAESDKEQYRRELSILSDCYEATFRKGQNANPDTLGEMQVVMMWIYQLEDFLVDGVRSRDSISLILLGHFCVLLHTLRGFWFMRDWGQHVITEIVQVSEPSRKWLKWPLQFIDGQKTPSALLGAA